MWVLALCVGLMVLASASGAATPGPTVSGSPTAAARPAIAPVAGGAPRATVSSGSPSPPAAGPGGIRPGPIERDIFLRAARNAMARRDLAEALRRFETLLGRFADEHEGRREYAGALAQAGRLAEASTQFRRLLDRFPERMDIREALGDVHVTMKDYREARAQYARVLAARKGDRRIRGKLAHVTLWGRDFDQALRRFQELLDESLEQHDLWPGYLDAACGARQVGEPQRRTALALFEMMPTTPFKDPVRLGRLGTLLRLVKERSSAIQAFERALALAPGDRLIRLQLADTAHEAGELAKAEEHYKVLLGTIGEER